MLLANKGSLWIYMHNKDLEFHTLANLRTSYAKDNAVANNFWTLLGSIDPSFAAIASTSDLHNEKYSKMQYYFMTYFGEPSCSLIKFFFVILTMILWAASDEAGMENIYDNYDAA